MSDTINIPVVEINVWTNVFTAIKDTSGSVTIAMSGQHCIHTSDPDPSLIGHRSTGHMQLFSLIEGESLWVRSSSETTVIITED